MKYSILWAIKVPTLANYRFFTPKVQWDFQKWTFINVQFSKTHPRFKKNDENITQIIMLTILF
jgi:hypothetical protein